MSERIGGWLHGTVVINVNIMIDIVIIVFSTIRDRYVDRSLPILSTTALPQGVSCILSYRIVFKLDVCLSAVSLIISPRMFQKMKITNNEAGYFELVR